MFKWLFRIFIIVFISPLSAQPLQPVYAEIDSNFTPFASTASPEELTHQLPVGGGKHWFVVKTNTPNGCEVMVANTSTMTYMSMNGILTCDDVKEVTVTKTKENSTYEIEFQPKGETIKVMGAE